MTQTPYRILLLRHIVILNSPKLIVTHYETVSNTQAVDRTCDPEAMFCLNYKESSCGTGFRPNYKDLKYRCGRPGVGDNTIKLLAVFVSSRNTGNLTLFYANTSRVSKLILPQYKHYFRVGGIYS